MSDGKILSGQQYNEHKNVVLPYTEQMMDYSGATTKVTGIEGQVKTEITPNDAASAKARVFDTTTIEASLAAISFSWPGKVSFYLPDVLTGITIVWNKTAGDGASSHPVANQAAFFYGSGSASLNPKASAQGSAAIVPDIQPTIKRYVSQDISCINYSFYTAGTVTLATVLSRLGTIIGTAVNAMPVWKPEQHTITGKGMQVSVQASADTSASVSGSAATSAYAYEFGSGYSKEVGVTNRTEVIPPTIHGTITISSATDSQAVSATVDASSSALYLNGVIFVTAKSNAPAATTATASGAVTPTTLAATSPAAIPLTGLYLVDISASPDDFGLVFIRCSVVDFSIYA